MPISKPSFSSFTKRYQRYRSTQVRYASQKQIDALINAHMHNAKDKCVQEVFSKSFLSKWRKDIIKDKSISLDYRNRMISILLSMAKQASAWHYITSASLRDVTDLLRPIPVTHPKKEKAFYTKEEIERFLGCIEDEEDRLMFELFAYLGCRIGEFLGLTWDCLGDGYLEIKQQCGHEGRGKWILTPALKTKESYRKCPLPPHLYQDLLERRISGSGRFFLFSLKKNHRAPYGETSFRNKIVEYATKAGLPILTPHCFRHSKATMLLEVCKNMEEVKSAARFLGHSATMLLDTYGHAKEETMLDILSRLE